MARLSRREYAIKRRCEQWGTPYRRIRRRDVFVRDGWTCQLCGEPIDQKARYPNRMCASVDHVVPISRGGEHAMHNLQSAHLLCNQRKGTKYGEDSEG